MGIKGKLEDISIPDLIQIVSISERSGKLAIKRIKDRAAVLFDKGKIVQATSTTYKKNIGDILLEKAFIPEEKLDEALASQKDLFEWKQLGGICVDRDFITKDQLEEAIKTLITEIINDLMNWDEGSFNFEVGITKIEDDINIDMRELILRSGISSEFFLLEGMKIQEKKRCKKPKGTAKKSTKSKKRTKEELSAEIFPENRYFKDKNENSAEDIAPDAQMEAPDHLLKGILEDIDPDFFSDLDTKGSDEEKHALSKENQKVFKIYSEIKKLKSLLRKVNSAVLSQEFSFAVMRFASEFVSRLLLFVVEAEHARCVGHMGISDDKLVKEAQIRNMRIPLDQPSFFRRVLDDGEIYQGILHDTHWNKFLTQKIGGKIGEDILVVPISIVNEIRFVLYADNYPGGKMQKEISELEAFVYQAGMALEISILERK